MIESLDHGWRPRVTTLLLLGFALGCSSATPQGQTTDGAGATAGSAGTSAQGGSSAVSGSSSTAGNTSSGGTSSGGTSFGGTSAGGSGTNTSGTGGAASGGGGMSSTGGNTSTPSCDTPGLTWKTARKTWYESYPDPGSEECVKYNGCMWAGQFAACDGKKPEEWVKQHNIVAAFPGFESLALHDLCLKSGDKTLIVTVLDTCGDEDCDGCCTENKGSADALIDLEKYTNERWGLQDGPIQWADLGPTRSTGCQ